jgi:serine/threonine protein kinase
VHIPEPDTIEPLEQKFPYVSERSLDFMKVNKLNIIFLRNLLSFIHQSCLVMDPDKRLTCGQLLQHPYFDGFNNEFERERKEQQKHSHREQQKFLQQQAKLQNNVYVTGNKQQNQGVSLKDSILKKQTFIRSIFHPYLAIKIMKEIIPQRLMNVLDAIFIYPIFV